MRYLGIDYGTKRVGVALSDESGTLAFPHEILENKNDLVNTIKVICEKEGIGAIVIGESLNYGMEPNLVMKKINKFISSLKEVVNLPVILEREFLSTQQARFYQRDRHHVDDSAAAIILQSFFDRQQASGNRL